MPNKPKEYGSPLGTPTPSTERDTTRSKARDPDPGVVREAMKKASTRTPDFSTRADKPVRGSSSAPSKRQRVLRRTEEEIDKQSQ
jgi:hypothetical protein